MRQAWQLASGFHFRRNLLILFICFIQQVKVIGSNTNIYIVMELAEGGDLHDKIRNYGYTSEQEVKRHFLQILAAMSYCHERGVTHRDLQCENISLDKHGNILVADKLRLFCKFQYRWIFNLIMR